MGENVLYLDCYNGISGDMFLGALIDCGLSLECLTEALSGLKVDGYRLKAERVCRYGISGTDFQVSVGTGQSFRNINDISGLINNSRLPSIVIGQSLAVFERLAAVEARIHGVEIGQVHFHEIGALDSIIDIVGTVCGLHFLNIKEIISSPLPLGRGFVETEHGRLPLPAPATTGLLAEAGVPVYGVEQRGELVTPTGAALVSVLAREYGKIPAMRMEKVGYGAGNKDFGVPNFLRVFFGSREKSVTVYSEDVNIIEANIDDMSGEITGYVMDKLISEGALDVFFTPVQMKKNRPAVKISVLAAPDKTVLLSEILLRETTTLGCRVQAAAKVMLPRRVEEVTTPWGAVRIKIVGGIKDKEVTEDSKEPILRFAPEYEDCAAIARRENIPLIDVYRAIENSVLRGRSC